MPTLKHRTGISGRMLGAFFENRNTAKRSLQIARLCLYAARLSDGLELLHVWRAGALEELSEGLLLPHLARSATTCFASLRLRGHRHWSNAVQQHKLGLDAPALGLVAVLPLCPCTSYGVAFGERLVISTSPSSPL